MTYVVYEKAQYSEYKTEKKAPTSCTTRDERNHISGSLKGVHRFSQPSKKMPLVVPKPSFMPSYLVRTSDMKVVQGSEVNEGYCTLSYSWNQSGEIVKNEATGESDFRIDQGKHKIIFPAKTVRKKPRGRKRVPRTVTFVTFEGLIQEICKDFNVKYIWYDQMCINQNDEKEKHCEIHQMHKIYSNAYCTIALVPELEALMHKNYASSRLSVTGASHRTLLRSQWMKRMWTLEEAVMSSRMLFVGRNIHYWWYCLFKYDNPIFYKRSNRGAANVLHYAHTRTSTKEHDRIFALANIFPDVMREITIDYNQDIQELMIQFYGILAEKDLSILCFGPHRTNGYKVMCKTSFTTHVNNNSKRKPEYSIPIQKFDLPSWTGIYGQHYERNDHKSCFKNYSIIGRALRMTCNGMTNHQHHTEMEALASFTLEDIPLLPRQKINNDTAWRLVISVRPPGSTQDKLIGLYKPVGTENELHAKFRQTVIKSLQNLSHFMSIKKENIRWISTRSKLSLTSIFFGNLTETLEDFTQYVLLNEVQFRHSQNTRASLRYPVIKKNGKYYKAIGLCSILNADHFLNDIKNEERPFEIH